MYDLQFILSHFPYCTVSEFPGGATLSVLLLDSIIKIIELNIPLFVYTIKEKN